MAQSAISISEADVLAARKSATRLLLCNKVPVEDEDILTFATVYLACTKQGVEHPHALEIATTPFRHHPSSQVSSLTLEYILSSAAQWETKNIFSGVYQAVQTTQAPPVVRIGSALYRRSHTSKPTVIGCNAALDEIQTSIIQLLSYDSSTLSNPLSPILYDSFLLHGPPGTGKTSLCRLASYKLQEQSSLPTYYASFGPADFSKWVGESSQQLVKKFEQTGNPDGLGIFVIDDIDMVLQGREDTYQSTGMLHVTAQLMHMLSGMESSTLGNRLFFATTNRVDQLDSALRRRFDCELYIPGYTSVEHYKEHLCAFYPTLPKSVAEIGYQKKLSPANFAKYTKQVAREQWKLNQDRC